MRKHHHGETWLHNVEITCTIHLLTIIKIMFLLRKFTSSVCAICPSARGSNSAVGGASKILKN